MKTTTNFKSLILKKANNLMETAINFTNQDDDYSTEWWDVHEFAEDAADFFLNDETTINKEELTTQMEQMKSYVEKFSTPEFESVKDEWNEVELLAQMVEYGSAD